MRKLFVLVALAFAFAFAFTANAQINFNKVPLPDLLNQAKTQKKLVFIDGYTDWCGWCKVLDREVFNDSAFGAYMNERFVCTRMEMEKEEWGKKVGLKYAIRSYPTTLILDADGYIIAMLAGYSPKDEYLKRVQDAIDPAGRKPIKGYNNQYDLAYPDFYVKAAKGGDEAGKVTAKQVNDYLRNAKDKTSEISWSVWKRFAYQLDSRNKEYFFSKHKTFTELYGPREVSQLVEVFISVIIDSAIKKKDPAILESAQKLTDQYSTNPTENRFWNQLNYYDQTGDWTRFGAMVREAVNKKVSFINPSIINNLSWGIYEHVTEPEVLNDAVVWMKNVTDLVPDSYMYLDTYAALLYKVGRYADAEPMARKAIEAGNKTNEDVKSTIDLLGKIKSAQNTGK